MLGIAARAFCQPRPCRQGKSFGAWAKIPPWYGRQLQTDRRAAFPFRCVNV